MTPKLNFIERQVFRLAFREFLSIIHMGCCPEDREHIKEAIRHARDKLVGPEQYEPQEAHFQAPPRIRLAITELSIGLAQLLKRVYDNSRVCSEDIDELNDMTLKIKGIKVACGLPV